MSGVGAPDAATAEPSVPVLVTLRERAHGSFEAGDAPRMIAALRRSAASSQARLKARTGIRRARGFWIVNALSTRATPAMIRRLRRDPTVATVTLDPVVRTATAPPPGSATADSSPPWGLRAIRAPAAWALGADGAGVVIGSIDTGVDATHPALAGRITAWRDFVGGRPTPYDDNGHGTHTVGTMIGAGIGVAPGARAIVARAMGPDGTGAGSGILAAAQWLTDPDGDPATADHPDIVNNSWTDAAGGEWFRPILRRWRELGIVAVFAVGNGGPGGATVSGGARLPEAFSVGAVDDDGRVTGVSARGPVTWSDHDGSGPPAGTVLPKPDVVAPGAGIRSAVPGGFGVYSGTSMAAPHVSGTAALVRDAAPGLTLGEVEDVLRASARRPPGAGWTPDRGFGTVDALRAVRRATSPAGAVVRGRRDVAPAPRVELSVRQIRINQRIAQAALRRVNAVRAGLLSGRVAAAPRIPPAARLRLSAAQLVVNQRISRTALRRVKALEAHLDGRPAPRRATRGPRRPVTLSAAQLVIDQRIAQEALRRVSALERRLEGRT